MASRGVGLQLVGLQSGSVHRPLKRTEPNELAAQEMVNLLRQALSMLCGEVRAVNRYNESLERQCAIYDAQIRRALTNSKLDFADVSPSHAVPYSSNVPDAAVENAMEEQMMETFNENDVQAHSDLASSIKACLGTAVAQHATLTGCELGSTQEIIAASSRKTSSIEEVAAARSRETSSIKTFVDTRTVQHDSRTEDGFWSGARHFGSDSSGTAIRYPSRLESYVENQRNHGSFESHQIVMTPPAAASGNLNEQRSVFFPSPDPCRLSIKTSDSPTATPRRAQSMKRSVTFRSPSQSSKSKTPSCRSSTTSEETSEDELYSPLNTQEIANVMREFAEVRAQVAMQPSWSSCSDNSPIHGSYFNRPSHASM